VKKNKDGDIGMETPVVQDKTNVPKRLELVVMHIIANKSTQQQYPLKANKLFHFVLHNVSDEMVQGSFSNFGFGCTD
jgi:hypothetical protein